MRDKIKAVVQTKKNSDYVWTCDFCGKEFKTKKLSDLHELKCIKNPQNSRFFILIGVLVFIGILFFIDFVVKAKEKSNLIPQQEQQLIPTITLTPTPTSKPKTQNTSNNTNIPQTECIGPDGKHFNTTMDECKKLAEKWGKSVDYMVNCTYPEECGGGVRRIPKSECDVPCKSTKTNTNKPNASNYVMVSLYDGSMTVWCKPEVVQTLNSLYPQVKESSKLWADTCVVASPPAQCDSLKQDANRKEDNYKSIFMNNCVNEK